jgi:hypothetical protein
VAFVHEAQQLGVAGRKRARAVKKAAGDGGLSGALARRRGA